MIEWLWEIPKNARKEEPVKVRVIAEGVRTFAIDKSGIRRLRKSSEETFKQYGIVASNKWNHYFYTREDAETFKTKYRNQLHVKQNKEEHVPCDRQETYYKAADIETNEHALPCPFCGSHDIYYKKYVHAVGERWAIGCLNCMATIDCGYAQKPSVAMDKWNTRTEIKTETI